MQRGTVVLLLGESKEREGGGRWECVGLPGRPRGGEQIQLGHSQAGKHSGE